MSRGGLSANDEKGKNTLNDNNNNSVLGGLG